MLKQKKSEKRSPLQNLNALHFHTSNSKKTSNLSSFSSASATSVEARNGCLRFLLSSNSSSDTSLPSSSSRSHLHRKPKVADNVSVKSFRSKENELPRKPFLTKSKKNQQLCVEGRGNGKSNTNPICKTAQRSKLSCGRGNSVKILKKGSEELEGKRLKSSTTLGESSSVRRNAAKDSDSRTANGGSATSAKTPPVEESLSPEIQSKMKGLNSAATPVCYGAGHLLSGVTDKRKCRRRGSLRGACEKINLFDDEENDKNVIDDLKDSLIPLPAEASVRWLLSPCDEGGEDQGSDLEIKLEECEMSCGNASLELDLLSSPSILCGNESELGCDNSDFRGSGSVDDDANLRKSGIFMLSSQENPEFQCLLGNSVKKMCDSFLAATPNSMSNCNSVGLGEGENVRYSVSENSSTVSLGSISSGNIIQTPNSDSSLYGCNRRLNVEVDHKSSIQFELGSITETLDAMSLSSGSEMSMPGAPSLSFPYAGLDSSDHSFIPINLQKNVDSVCSWRSSCTLENLTLSQMNISWRDGLECRIDENDEFDCCPCLSDEDIDAVGCSDQKLKPYRLSQSGGEEENKYEVNDLWRINDVSPILLEYEPCISTVRKEKITGDRLNTCAESIYMSGGDLAASCDSDWTNSQESHLFQVK
ncbi:hypothetical protein C2S51_027102 [Perilla frutescens var. frutescens]|nr:hypothetical protein C2S51_027102 [Perilla frutescens var. frutescens]